MAVGLTMGAAAPAAAATPGRYYESFQGIELAAGFLDSPSSGAGLHLGNATNIAVGGGAVYWQDGVNINKSSLDLSTTSLFHVNGIAPTDIAIDAAHNRYYESFAGIELAAGFLDSPSLGAGLHVGNATNIAIGADGVYWQDGVDIYKSSFDLSTTTLFHVNGIAPTDIAIDAAHDRYYESFAGIELAAGFLDAPSSGAGLHLGNATNIAIGADGVYWQDGVDIYRSSFDLSTTTLFHTNGIAPTDLAIQPAITGVPEPGLWSLMLVGFGLAGAVLRSDRRRPAAHAN